jgi:membrane protein
MAQATLSRPVNFFGVLKDAFHKWREDKTVSMGAALAYYAVFSIAPMLIICIAIAGSVFGEAKARGEVVDQLEAVAGENIAEAVKGALKYVQESEGGLLATVISVVVLLVTSGGMFTELQDSLNTIWEVQARKDRSWLVAIRERLMPFLMVFLSGALLVGLLMLNSILTVVVRYVPSEQIPGAVYFWRGIDWGVTFGVATLMIALVYKVLPDVKLRWRDVWVGAVVTALLLLAGNWLIGLYLGWSGMASAYGAAGSLVVILLWVYYSSQVFLFGAELTYAYAMRGGKRPDPKPNAESICPPGSPA